MKVWVVNLIYTVPEVFVPTIERFYEYCGVDVEYVIVNNNYPVEQDRIRAYIYALARKHKMHILEPGENLGIARGILYSCEKMQMDDDDIVIFYDHDAYPLTHDFGKTAVKSMDKGDLIFAGFTNKNFDGIGDDLTVPGVDTNLKRINYERDRGLLLVSSAAFRAGALKQMVRIIDKHYFDIVPLVNMVSKDTDRDAVMMNDIKEDLHTYLSTVFMPDDYMEYKRLTVNPSFKMTFEEYILNRDKIKSEGAGLTSAIFLNDISIETGYIKALREARGMMPGMIDMAIKDMEKCGLITDADTKEKIKKLRQ